VLLDAGADPNDAGDDAHIGVIGWATMTPPSGEIAMDVVALLVARGARHHIFSAIATGDLEVLRGSDRAAPRSAGPAIVRRATTGRHRCTTPSRASDPTSWIC
jgi:hypothetical protein